MSPAAPAAIELSRALLFTPGNRPDRFSKGASSGADGLILDLEDAVAPASKDAARAGVIDYFRGDFRAVAPACQRGLRVNNIHTAAGVKDLDALVSARIEPDFIVLPKVESAFEVRLYVRLLAGPQSSVPFVCSIESAAGLEQAFAIAAADPRVRALAFGGADLAVDLRAVLAWEPMYWGRARVVQAGAAAAIGVLDVPQITLDDERGLREDCARVKAMGFTGKLAIHPRQVIPIQESFAPSASEVARAAAMVEAFRRAGGNAVEFEGRMVEGPIVKAAERTLALARLAGIAVS
jgi:(S)-citramalyl-CoA lyase